MELMGAVAGSGRNLRLLGVSRSMKLVLEIKQR
jgi:hypothetical protein